MGEADVPNRVGIHSPKKSSLLAQQLVKEIVTEGLVAGDRLAPEAVMGGVTMSALHPKADIQELVSPRPASPQIRQTAQAKAGAVPRPQRLPGTPLAMALVIARRFDTECPTSLSKRRVSLADTHGGNLRRNCLIF